MSTNDGNAKVVVEEGDVIALRGSYVSSPCFSRWAGVGRSSSFVGCRDINAERDKASGEDIDR